MGGKRSSLGKRQKGKAQVRPKTAKVESVPSTPDVVVPPPSPSSIHDIIVELMAKKYGGTVIGKPIRISTKNSCGAEVCPLCDFISGRKV